MSGRPHGSRGEALWTRREAVRTLSACAFVIVLPGLAACGRSRKGSATPPTVVFHEDVCEWCRMTVDDPRLVAAFVPVSGPALRFGEPGCLIAWLAEHRNPEGVAFVAAREDGGWLTAATATFARGAVRTPMRFDLAAWRDSPAVGGERLTWARLLEQGAPRAQRN